MWYFIILAIILVITFGCLRNKFKSLPVVLVLSCSLAGLLSSFVYTIVFFANEKTRTIELTEYKGELVIPNSWPGRRDVYIRTDDGKAFYTVRDISKVKIGPETKRVDREVYLSDKFGSNLWGVKFKEDKFSSVTLHVTEQDYEVLKAFIDSLEERD